MKKQNVITTILVSLTLLCLSGCYTHTNNPPTSNAPEPAPHDGIFVSEDNDTLFFNGDGRTIRWHFVAGVPEIGLEGSGTYVFKFGNWQYRYDLAEYFFIYTDSPDSHYENFHLSIENRVSETAIPVMRYDISNDKQQVFRKVQ